MSPETVYVKQRSQSTTMSERKQKEWHRRKRQAHTDKTLVLLNKLVAQDEMIQQQAQRIAELEAELAKRQQ